jgi:N-acetylglucosamine-6-phosphate deacetylase
VTTVIHSARKLDASGEQDRFWMLIGDGSMPPDRSILATGTGEWPAADTVVDARGHWMVPGFIDLHGHGGGGHQYDDGAEAITAGLAAHRAHGTTRSLISLVANPLDALLTSLGAIADLAADDPLVLGAHLEGPFLASERRGAHHPGHLLEPQPGIVEELIGAGRGTLRLLTIAPELPNALESVDVLVENQVTVAVGHTEASFEQAGEAFDRGARVLTHAFNAMPGIHHRAPGPVVAALEDDRVTLELILDGMHVHPAVAKLAFDGAPGRIALITDAMSAAGVGDGDYRLGALNVSVREGLAMLSGTDTIAGSTLTQDDALRRAIEFVEPREAIEALTRTPARALGLEHRFGMLAPGFVADAVLLDRDWRVTSVWANGALLS